MDKLSSDGVYELYPYELYELWFCLDKQLICSL